jgi:hypothetical protein
MSGHIPTPEIQVFKEINIEKYKTTRHFESINLVKTHQTDKINIVTDRKFAKSLPDYWLSYRFNNRWKRITGLFKVENTNYYKGDIGRNNIKESLVIVGIDKPKGIVKVCIFKGYYSKNPIPAIMRIK